MPVQVQVVKSKPTLPDGTPVLTKADCLRLLSDIECAIDATVSAMGMGLDHKSRHEGDIKRQGKLQAYEYCKGRLLAMMRWKSISVE
jgi:hypothetical protein